MPRDPLPSFKQLPSNAKSWLEVQRQEVKKLVS
ncbi:hypothetical protein DFO48_105538 [Comamonas sp. AG1104]|nr:hypothetical protein DFO48_105538 [Comamonas sp. AG1104]